MILEVGKKIRIERILSNLGVCNRSQVPQFLKEKRVTVLGRKVTPATKANSKDIRIDGKPIENGEPLHIAVHKPTGYICSTVNDGDHKVIYDILPKEFIKRRPNLSIAGRLDKWVTGLVVMSQDGRLVDRIITPKDDGCGKDYQVVLKDKLVGDESKAFESGELMLRGEELPCKPAKLQVLDEEKNKVLVTLYEGRYHQIRRMFAATENKAVEIHRTRIGPVSLGDLEVGKWRYLTPSELTELYKIESNVSIEKKKNNKNKSFKLKKLSLSTTTNNKGEEIDEDESEEYEDEIDEEEEEEYDEDEYDEEEKRNFDEMYDENGRIKYKFTSNNQSTLNEGGFRNDNTNNINTNNINYEDKLRALVDNEESEIKKTEIFNQLEMDRNIQKEIENIENIEDEEYDDEDEIEKKNKDPYEMIRQQFHNKFRSMIKSTDKSAQFDEDTGYYIPISKRTSKYDDISDQDLERLISLDKDMKTIAIATQEEEDKLRQEEEDKLKPKVKTTNKTAYTPKSKSRFLKDDDIDIDDNDTNINNNSKNNNDNHDENVIKIDSTPIRSTNLKKDKKQSSSLSSSTGNSSSTMAKRLSKNMSKKKDSRRSGKTNKK